jgi:hypothetical protein
MRHLVLEQQAVTLCQLCVVRRQFPSLDKQVCVLLVHYLREKTLCTVML